MTAEMYDTTEELRQLIADNRLSQDALLAITGIPPAKLRALLDAKHNAPGLTSEPQALSADEITRLSILTAHLTEGMQIPDDQRLTAILESLTVECRLTLENLAHLTGLDVASLEQALRDPTTITVEQKFELAIKGSYLIEAVNRARGQ